MLNSLAVHAANWQIPEVKLKACAMLSERVERHAGGMFAYGAGKYSLDKRKPEIC